MSKCSFLIPGFTLTQQCGQGATSEVWIGVDRHGVRRAVRILHKKNVSDLLREYNSIASYRSFSGHHENLLDFLYTGETAECCYYISEPADNVASDRKSAHYEPDTLSWRIRNRGICSREVFHLIMDILAGLQEIHAHGLAHNDLKPENIIFVHRKLKLADPGLLYPSQKKISGGTAGFRPDWDANGIEADIYALGKIIYCMIISSNEPACFPVLPPMSFDPFLVELNEIALRCCEKDARIRFHNCLQIRQALLALRKKYLEPVKKPNWLFLFSMVLVLLLIISLFWNGWLYQQNTALEKSLRVLTISYLSKNFSSKTVLKKTVLGNGR